MRSASAALIALILLLPLATADVQPGAATVEKLVGDCDATLDVIPLLMRLLFDSRTSSPHTQMVSGSRITVQEAEGTDAHARRSGALGDGPLYTHQDSKIVNSVEYTDFRLDLTGFHDGAMVTLLPAHPSWLSASATRGFTLANEAPVLAQETADPRHGFKAEPASMLLEAAVDDLAWAGDVEILVEQASFDILADGERHTFDAKDEPVVGGTADAENVHYYVLLIEDARVTIADAPVAADLFADVVNVHCVGALLDATTSDVELLAEGIVDLAPRAGSDETIVVPFTVTEPTDAAPEAATVGVAPSAFPYWTILLALGFVATGGGAAVYRFTRKAPVVPPEAPAIAPPTVKPTPGPRTIPQLETAYRADPSDTVLALELGLAYAKEHRAHDALPLLQLAIQDYPKMDAARYFAGVALLDLGRVDEALRHLAYAFRLNALNVARFINEGAAQKHGHHARVRALLAGWSRRFQDANSRGYA